MGLFEQTYLAGRVTEEDGIFNIQFSVLEGKTISMAFDNENDAKIAYNMIEREYLEALNVLQEAVLRSM